MKMWSLSTVVVLSLIGLSAAAADDSVEKTLIGLEKSWAKAIEAKDVKAMDAILADSFISVEPDGQLLNKKQYLEARVKDPEKIESSSLEDMQVRVHGHAATVTGRYLVKGKLNDARVTHEFRWVDVFISQNGSWKCVSTQLTPLLKKK